VAIASSVASDGDGVAHPRKAQRATFRVDLDADEVLGNELHDEEESWAAGLLNDRGGLADAVGRMVGSIGLAAIYGVALGAREGGMALAIHAWGVPAALLAVLALGVPAMLIVLALFDTPLRAGQVARCVGCGAAATGLTLAGLAPAAALFVVTSESHGAAALVAALGLALASLVGAAHLVVGLARLLDGVDRSKRSWAIVVLSGFVLFAAVLAVRVWQATVPILDAALLGGAP